ncbi:MAG: cell division protein ZapA [Parvibaculales bacterium]
MAEMTIHVNERSYQIMCRDGDEAEVSKLAADLAARVATIARDMNQSATVGDSHLLVLASLTMLSEMRDLQHDKDVVESDVSKAGAARENLSTRLDDMEQAVVAALTQAAEKIEAMAQPNANGDLPSEQ